MATADPARSNGREPACLGAAGASSTSREAARVPLVSVTPTLPSLFLACVGGKQYGGEIINGWQQVIVASRRVSSFPSPT